MEVLCIVRVLNRAVMLRKQPFLFHEISLYDRERGHFKTFAFQAVATETQCKPKAHRVQR